ncbi:hypothetical protein KUTeg_018946 [Tegillarca granosa]|uniref:Ileal sodium/bile acid cotransporter n=1 Tax=Tegillarca granosa TaxID=220873 RepID=A0ABQ9EGJ4_TEGGR|nr:hypothetical protein KUTeg_018946 [Tegillarca granosa]
MDVFVRTLGFMFCVLPCVMCVSVRNATDLATMTYMNALQHYPVVMDEGEVHHLEYNWTYMDINSVQLLVIASSEEIVTLESDHLINLYDTNNFSLDISAVFLGRSYLEFYVNKSLPGTERSPNVNYFSTQWYKLPDRFEIVVRRKDGVLNRIFTVSVIVLVCLANVAMGCKTDLQIVKQTLKKPVAPVTGLVSQFLLMPMIAFGLGYAMSLEPALAFGLFATGCSPGGSASNVYTYLLDGNVSLSVTMTFVSTILSLGVAIVLLQLSLPPPDSDISIVPPIAAAIFTPIPLLIAIVIHEVREFMDINYNVDSPYVILEEDSKHIHFNITIHDSDSLVMLARSSNEEIVSVVSSGWYELNGNSSTNSTVKIRGVFLGRAYLNFHVNKPYPTSLPSSPSLPKGGNSNILNVTKWYHISGEDFEVVVTRVDTVINTIFTVTVIVLVCLANVAMGCKTDILVVRETLRKPIAPVTGLLSQFIIMPMVSFAVGQALRLDAPMAFGFFAMGCSPGGAASNIYTFLLDGDVSLSVTMTFISTVLSIAMIPMWLYTLGIHVIYNNTSNITIPFVNIFMSLLGLLIPVGIGVLIQKKKPSLAKKILMAVKPLTVIFVILVFTVGVYANLYIFKLLTPLVLLTGALIPYCGFAFGALVAFIARQPKGRIMTIAIETGIQNSGIAIVLLQLSLPPPDSDIGVVGPIICTIFTPIPMAIAIISYEIYKRCFKKKDDFDNLADKTQTPDDKDQQLNALSYKPVHGVSNNAQTDVDNNERSSDNGEKENQHQV